MVTAEREARIRALVERLDRVRMMGAEEPWELLTASRDLLVEVERLRRQLPRQLALPGAAQFER